MKSANKAFIAMRAFKGAAAALIACIVIISCLCLSPLLGALLHNTAALKGGGWVFYLPKHEIRLFCKGEVYAILSADNTLSIKRTPNTATKQTDFMVLFKDRKDYEKVASCNALESKEITTSYQQTQHDSSLLYSVVKTDEPKAQALLNKH